MHKDELAKFLLSRFTTGERAAAIVGDLMEICPGHLKFWHAVAVTASALSRRAGIGVLAAAGAGLLVRRAYFLTLKASNPIHGIAACCIVSMMLLTLVAAYSAVRRGAVDPVTKTASALCLLASAGAFLRLVAWVPPVCAAAAVLLIVVLLNTTQGRKALLSILLAGSAGLGASYASWRLLVSFANPVRHSAIAQSGCIVLLPAVSVAAVLSWSYLTPVSLPGSAVQRT